jgi:oligopeptide/dipeptide ABC transporter ATP-binding protein
MPLLEISNLSVTFGGGFLLKNLFWALRDINLSLEEKESLTILGESGSGKSTLAKVLVRLIKPTGGEVLYKGKNIFGDWGKEYTKEVSIVFQDPRSSLNPRYTVWEAVEEPLKVHKVPKNRREELVEKYLLWSKVDRELWSRKVINLSGGQRQRVAIARALVLEPALVIADEPTSALDLSVQYEILKLFVKLKTELGKSLIFITHDVRIGAKVSDKTAVLLGGRLMEIGKTPEVLKKPFHPYTEFLLSSLPVSSPYERRPVEDVEVKTLRDEGCPFRTVCKRALPQCNIFPKEPIKRGDRKVWCYNPF